MKKMLAVAVVSMVALTAQAGIEANFVMTGQGAVEAGGPMFNIYELQVTTDTDWTNSRLDIALSAGSFGNHAFQNEDGAPPLAALFGSFPELANDSFFQTPSGSAASTADLTFPQAAPSGDTVVGLSWFDTEDTGAGTHTLMQLAISTDAVGTIAGKNYDLDTAGVGVDVGMVGDVGGSWSVVGGEVVWVPEPATIGLLVLGGVALLKRRS